ncbi:MAG: rhomboid family intramembrane serine protease [Vicinamibacterales bacterium]
MSRPYAPSRSSVSFGPGPLSLTLQVIIGANVALFLAQTFLSGGFSLASYLGLTVVRVVNDFMIWQVATYMFLHGGLLHLLFNMLALWMFGTELERIWGTRYFLKYYFACGIGAAVLTVLFALLPLSAAVGLRYAPIIGASGAIYGLLLAYGLYFPDRPILLYMVFPIPAKYFVILMGAIAFYSSLTDNGGGVANMTHLGGLIIGYLMLKGARFHPLSETKYWYLRWKMQRVRRKFGVHQGGRSGGSWNRRVH